MSKPVHRTKAGTKSRPSSTSQAASQEQATVSPKWLLGAIGIAIAAALACTWGTLCLVFWQGSWQLLYHPTTPITRTPASKGIAFDNVEFAPSQAGIPLLKGWWLPGGPESRYTAIYLHGADGNLSDTVDDLTRLHAAKLNVLAFDYRGYGQSQFVRPSETHLREDAESAIAYLKDTRHISAGSLVLVGSGLGANLALQVAAAHPELAGVVLETPIEAPADAIFRDSRARLVPARALVSDRWDSSVAAANLQIPSLWFCREPNQRHDLFHRVTARKVIVWLKRPETEEGDYAEALGRWLDELPGKR